MSLTLPQREAIERVGLGCLILAVLELPDQIRTATEDVARQEANLRNAKDELKERQAKLKSGEELVGGKKLEGTVGEKEAQIFILTEVERNRVAIREQDLETAKRRLEYLQNQMNAHRAASRYAYASTGAELGK